MQANLVSNIWVKKIVITTKLYYIKPNMGSPSFLLFQTFLLLQCLFLSVFSGLLPELDFGLGYTKLC